MVDATEFPMDAMIKSVELGVCKGGVSLTLGVFRQKSGGLELLRTVEIPQKKMTTGIVKVCAVFIHR